MENLTLLDMNIEFSAITGEVIDESAHSETEVYSTGGGSTYTPNGPRTNAVHVHSETTHSTKVWIKNEAGKEQLIEYPDSIAVRVGHRVSFVTAKNVDGKSGSYYVQFINHTTSSIKRLHSGREINKNLSIVLSNLKGNLQSLSFSTLVFLIVAFIFDNMGGAIVAFFVTHIAISVVRGVTLHKQDIRNGEIMEEHLTRIGDNLLVSNVT